MNIYFPVEDQDGNDRNFKWVLKSKQNKGKRVGKAFQIWNNVYINDTM